MNNKIDEPTLADLCPEIRSILDAELEAGNQIVRVSRDSSGYPAIVVDLYYNSFFIQPSSLPADLYFHPRDIQVCGIGDHYFCTKHAQCVMASV